MNAGIAECDPSILYYDGDYPSKDYNTYPENFDATTVYQGLAFDIARYLDLAAETKGDILELCCGTGRVAIPLANAGHNVTGVDVSQGVLEQFKNKLSDLTSEAKNKINIIQQDITQLSLDKKNYRLAIIAFNSLLCIPNFKQQIQALKCVAKHLDENGKLVLDIVNPLALQFNGDPHPKLFFTRKNPGNGNTYTRFSMCSAFDEEQKQRLFGWYDELDLHGVVTRKFYSMYWRPIFRYEIELMLMASGFCIEKIEGGHQKEPYTTQSPRMFIQACKMPDCN